MNRYTNITILGSPRYYVQNIYPEIPYSENDIYVITTRGDRYDLIAQTFYNSDKLWWILPLANPEIGFDSLFIPTGTQLRIPTNIQDILLEYNKLNSL